jgi:ribosomal protein S27AE
MVNRSYLGDQLKTFFFNCGHHAQTTGKTKRNKTVCPKCKAGTIQAIRLDCDDCGKLIGFEGSNGRRQTCDDCKEIRRQNNLARYVAGKTTSPKSKRETVHKKKALRRHDCKHYGKCLFTAALSNDKLDCKGCRQYRKVPLDVMDFLRTDSPLAQAADKFPVYSRLGRGARKGSKPLEIALAKG